MTKPLKTQRRLAAEILKCGETRVWFDPEALDEIEKATTREEIKKLIHERKIWKYPIEGVSHVRANIRAEQRRKGRRRGPGKRKGSKLARMGGKKFLWMIRIRAIRKMLDKLREYEIITRGVHEKLRKKAKAGAFRSKRHVVMYVLEHELNIAPIELLEMPEEIRMKYEEYTKTRRIPSELKRAFLAAIKFCEFANYAKESKEEEKMKKIIEWIPKKRLEIFSNLIEVLANYRIIRVDMKEVLMDYAKKVDDVKDLLEYSKEKNIAVTPLELLHLPKEIVMIYEEYVKNPGWEQEILTKLQRNLEKFMKKASEEEKNNASRVLEWVKNELKKFVT